MFGVLRPEPRAMDAQARACYRESYCYLAATLGRDFGIAGRLAVDRSVLLLYCLLAEAGGGDAAVRRWSACAPPRPLRCVRLCAPRPAPGDRLAEFVAALCCFAADVRARDDAADAPGLAARLRARLQAESGRAALDRLGALGLDVRQMKQALAEQRCLEAQRGLPLLAYCGPVERACRAAGRAGARLAGLDEGAAECAVAYAGHLARTAVLSDALLDHEDDARAGRFNPLDWSAPPGQVVECAALVQAALEGMAAAAGHLRCPRARAVTAACASALAARLPRPVALGGGT